MILLGNHRDQLDYVTRHRKSKLKEVQVDYFADFHDSLALVEDEKTGKKLAMRHVNRLATQS